MLKSRTAKRAMDITGALMGLPVLAIVLVIYTLIVWATGPGRIITYQLKVGKDGVAFPEYKLQTRPYDHRVGCGRVSRWLRFYGLDELPQLINIFKGQMSLVGPRPVNLANDNRFREQNPRWPDRYTVAPGIASWVEVKYPSRRVPPGQLPDHRLLALSFDLEGIDRSTVWFDLMILLRTAKEVFSHGHDQLARNPPQ